MGIWTGSYNEVERVLLHDILIIVKVQITSMTPESCFMNHDAWSQENNRKSFCAE